MIKMFNKRFEEISDRLDKLSSIIYSRDEMKMTNKEIRDIKMELSNSKSIIESQQCTIEQLTNALRDKYEHGLFVFSEDCKIPMVIRNGKEITNDMTESFSIEWEVGEIPNIEITQIAGTNSNTED